MAERRFLPVQGTAGNVRHYFGLIADFADSVGVATPLLDCVAPLYERFTEMGLDDKDVAAMIDVIDALPRAGHRK
jgi:3-hydroxyisobutyrate dehydrogenase-like beta-hydroxyacid dehydrogenase